MSQKYPSSKPAILHGIAVICAALLVASLAGAENRVSGVAAEGESLSITGISPNSGPVNGGTPVRVIGTDFSSGATLSIGGIAAVSVVRVEDNLITAVTPAVGTPGPADVAVTFPTANRPL